MKVKVLHSFYDKIVHKVYTCDFEGDMDPGIVERNRKYVRILEKPKMQETPENKMVTKEKEQVKTLLKTGPVKKPVRKK